MGSGGLIKENFLGWRRKKGRQDDKEAKYWLARKNTNGYEGTWDEIVI
jgi:hypothetical protein